MRGRWTVIAIAVVAILGLTAPARATTVAGLHLSTGGGCPAPPVDPPTRTGRIATANTYLRSLVTHDTSELRVSDDVVRTEEGGVTANGAKALCDGNQGPVTIEDAVLGMREIKWSVVDGDQAIAFYLLDSPSSPTYIAERFQVDGGLIHHIEAIFYIDTLGYAVGPESVPTRPDGVTERVFSSDSGPAGFFAPANRQGDLTVPGPADRTAVRNAARSYLAALVSHDPSKVPLADAAVRTENRRPRGSDATAIRAALASSNNVVSGVEDAHIYVEGDEAIAMYKLDTTANDKVGAGAAFGLSDVWAATRFRVRHGRIDEIESICSSSELCGSVA